MVNRSFLVNVSDGEAVNLKIIEFVNGGETLRMRPETGDEAKKILSMLIGDFNKGENNA